MKKLQALAIFQLQYRYKFKIVLQIATKIVLCNLP